MVPARMWIQIAQTPSHTALNSRRPWPPSQIPCATAPFSSARTISSGPPLLRNRTGKQAEAVAAYRAVIDSFPESPSMTEAKVRLAELTDGKM